MRCPFLREAQVKSCQASAQRKMIPRSAQREGHERCSSPAWVECPTVRAHLEEHPDPTHCPFLRESLVQYCAAAAAARYIPYSESSNCRCGRDAHRYCDEYLALAVPGGGSPSGHAEDAGPAAADGVEVPAGLAYARNHLWLDLAVDGTLHVGVDSLLAQVVGAIDHVIFVAHDGTRCPIAVLTVHGVDLALRFPNPITIVATNPALRMHPERLVVDPYGHGWLFEGVCGNGPGGATAGLLSGEQALPWMRDELARLASWIDGLGRRPGYLPQRPEAADGPSWAGLPERLTRDETLRLFEEFFPAGPLNGGSSTSGSSRRASSGRSRAARPSP